MGIFSNWLILSLSAALVWAVVNLLDKILVIEYIKSQWTRLILDSIIGLSSCIIIFFLGLLSQANLMVILLGILSGMLLYCFNYLYYKALETADVSVTSVLLQTIPIFTALWGYIFFDEIFGAIIYFGVALIIIGAMISNIEVDPKGNHKLIGGKNWNAAILYLLPGVFLVSVNYALQKYILQFSSNWTVFFWGRIGSAFLTVLLLILSKKIRTDFQVTIKKIKIIPIILLSGVEWLNLAGIFFILSAYATGPLTLVVTASSAQPLFVICIVLFVNILQKKNILSDFSNSKKVLLIRIIASLVLIFGVFLISQ